jgi:hypothetical protein
MPTGGYDVLKARMAKAKQSNAQRREIDNHPKFSVRQELAYQGPGEVPANKLPMVAQVRFVDDTDTFEWAWAHPVAKSGTRRDGSTWKVTLWRNCVDQTNHEFADPDDCPGDKAGLERKQRFWVNLIWRDAPIYETNEYGTPTKPLTIIGKEDQLVVWNTGRSLFDILEEIKTEFGDVTGRDYRLKVEFKGNYVIYSLAPRQPDPEPLSAKDKKLIEGRYDLRQFSKPMSYNELAAEIPGATPRQEEFEEEAAQSFTGNPYESAGEQVNSPLARPRN